MALRKLGGRKSCYGNLNQAYKGTYNNKLPSMMLITPAKVRLVVP